jgi:rod shape-determining protein MreC
MYPILVVQNSVVTPIKSFFHKRKSASELEIQLKDLQHERDAILAQNIELNGMISFVQDTQELVEFKERYECDNASLAQVLVKNFSEQAHYFLIDKGTRGGIQKDMAVVYKNVLIGKVHEVYPHYSKVVLVTDQSCKVAAYCAQSKATGIYQGSNEEWAAQLNHVSHLSQLEEGEMILSSGDGLIFPRGFGLGKVKMFQTQGLFHEVSVEPLLNLRALSYCYVVTKQEELKHETTNHSATT